MLFKKKEKIEEIIQFTCNACGEKNVKEIVINDTSYFESINKKHNACEKCGYTIPITRALTYEETEIYFNRNKEQIKAIQQSNKPKEEKLVLMAYYTTGNDISCLYEVYEYYKTMKNKMEERKYAEILIANLSLYDEYKFLLYQDDLNTKILKRCMNTMCMLVEAYCTLEEYNKPLDILNKYKDFAFNDEHKVLLTKVRAVKKICEKNTKRR